MNLCDCNSHYHRSILDVKNKNVGKQ